MKITNLTKEQLLIILSKGSLVFADKETMEYMGKELVTGTDEKGQFIIFNYESPEETYYSIQKLYQSENGKIVNISGNLLIFRNLNDAREKLQGLSE